MNNLTAFEIELIGKISVAKHEIKKLERKHLPGCAYDMDMWYKPCSCGASDFNHQVDGILKGLEIQIKK